MKQTYIQPAVKIVKVQTATMIAESLKVNQTTVNDAWARKEVDWDMWD